MVAATRIRVTKTPIAMNDPMPGVPSAFVEMLQKIAKIPMPIPRPIKLDKTLNKKSGFLIFLFLK